MNNIMVSIGVNDATITVVGVLWLLACIICLVDMFSSEEGYEDETGFHYGKPKIKKKK